MPTRDELYNTARINAVIAQEWVTEYQPPEVAVRPLQSGVAQAAAIAKRGDYFIAMMFWRDAMMAPMPFAQIIKVADNGTETMRFDSVKVAQQ